MIDIVIVDDHKLFAQGLASILSEDENLNVKAVFNDGRSMIDYLKNNSADIVLIDLNMPSFDGKSTLQKLKEDQIKTKRMILSMYAEDSLLRECIDIGIDAYLLKDTEPEILISTIKEVYDGVYNFDHLNIKKPISDKLFKDDFINKHKLSKREIEVVNLIVEGLTNQKIADKLFLSTYTIDTHRKNILQKLSVKNTAELVKMALEQNIK
ncbi:response regulator transcription factor [Pedobacter cryophilus]|uniref:Response regulator transcription factor n=1 Tax=Pedobacter cryophilus TaxID=2571271 RepID=A0A4U1BVD4_9SPHI|nr:response regulator transcription factor [Pedobacter cryophilus]TKB96759.1 response regulator transcription factor [Pedobacter cryophilus]